MGAEVAPGAMGKRSVVFGGVEAGIRPGPSTPPGLAGALLFRFT
ncbi:hypothetical protein [Nocardiopsis rhodophaea]